MELVCINNKLETGHGVLDIREGSTYNISNEYEIEMEFGKKKRKETICMVQLSDGRKYMKNRFSS